MSVIILLAHRFFFDYFRSVIQGFSSSQSKVMHFFGSLIFGLLSLALSVTAYTIFMPLALGALVAAIPGLLTPIHWLSEIAFFSHALAWLNGFPFIAALVSALIIQLISYLHI